MSGGRVLMLAHHFPPTGGSGSNRALAFARYLPIYGWRPTVITPAEAYAINRDDRLLGEVPPHVRVVRTRSFEAMPRRARAVATVQSNAAKPRAWRQQLGHVRRFPDAHIGWLPYALAAARRERYDIAYSSSGPFTSHLVGLLLKRLTGRPWIAELRDGWYRWNRAIFPDYPRWRDALERSLEAAALRTADRVILVTERMADAFRQQYPALPHEHFAVVSNGFDPAQFRADEAGWIEHAHAEGWRLVHAGALYYGRSVSALLAAAQRVIEADAAFGRDFTLRLIGTLDGSTHAEVGRSQLRVELAPQASHEHAIREMRAADALLLVANTTPGAEATVPGKLFEYLAVGRPVLALAPCESSTADVFKQTGGGWLAAADDVDEIARVLRQAYVERTTPNNLAGVARFDRRRLAGELAAMFDEVTCHRR